MESKALTLPERAAVALGTAKHEKELIELVKKSESITVIKNAAGRDQCHGALMALKSARVAIEKVGKAAREDATQFSKAIIAEEKRLVAITQTEEARLQEIRDAWDEAREREKREKAEAEARRVAKIRDAIEDFRRAPGGCPATSSAAIDEHADDLARQPIELDFYMELTGEAEAARDVAVAALRDMANKARAREAEDARIKAELLELARLRAEQEERDRIAAAERAEQERKAREALEAEEARLRAEREAEEAERREAQRKAEEAMRAERAEHERRMAAERAEFQRKQDEIAAEQRRAAAELQRQQDEIAAERRRVADEEARKQREADAAAAKALQEKLEAEAREIARRQAEWKALQNGAREMFETLKAVSDWLYDSNANPELQVRVDAAIAAATPEAVPA